MIGFLEATRGACYINGKNIRTEMDEVYSIMGVCPQDNLLWEPLTAREHLNFFGRLKGLSGKPLKEAVDRALHNVKLFDVGNKKAKEYSGGAQMLPSCVFSVQFCLSAAPHAQYLGV
jgi:ABC-type multidrug transport system ATPase subunit